MLRSFFCSVAVAIAVVASSSAQAPSNATFKPTHIVTMSGGKGPDVIFVPGLGGSRSVWETEANKLIQAHYRVHLIQIDGFAGFPAEANSGMKSGMLDAIVSDLHEYIQANQLKSPALIGHSLGGTLGIMLAEQHPGDVSKLVIVDAVPFLGLIYNADSITTDYKDDALQQRIALNEESRDLWLHNSVTYAQSFATAKPMQDKIALWSVNSDRKVFAQAAYEDSMADLRVDLAKVTIPVLVLWPHMPDDGPLAGREAFYRKAWAKAPNVKLVGIENSRHFIMLDQPEAVDREIQAFLKG